MSLLSSSLQGTTYLILLQATSRVLTFSLNQLILRYTTPSIFGFATVQLELLLSSILFLCREGFRVAIQRLPLDGHDKARDIINLSYIPVSTGLFTASILSWTYISQASAESQAIPYFTSTVYIYAASTIIELLSEPGYNVALHKLQYKLRAKCEGSAIFTRCVVTFVVSAYGGSGIGALAFALGQLAYSIVLLVLYQHSLRSTSVHILPGPLSSGKWFDVVLLKLSFANTAQGILKHILTEGDKIMISYFSSNKEQGTYGLAANYGGLIARIVLQPIEEASRSYFSNLLPFSVSSEAATRDTPNGTKSTQSPVSTKEEHERKETAKSILALIVRSYVILSLLLVSFGPKLTSDLLPQVLSPTWSQVTPVLSAYCYYIPLLALNGILEAFVSATASPGVMRRQGLFWLPCSLVFGVAGLLFRHRGAQGLVFANCLNLSMRIVWASVYTYNFFGGVEARSVLPPWTSLATISSCAACFRMIGSGSNSLTTYLCTTAALGLSTVIVIGAGEYQTLPTSVRTNMQQKLSILRRP